MMPEDQRGRTLAAPQFHPLQPVPALYDQCLLAWDQVHTTTNLLLRFTQNARSIAHVTALEFAAYTSQLYDSAVRLKLDGPHAKEKAPAPLQDQAGANKGTFGDQILQP
jgi:hypothetical protein